MATHMSDGQAVSNAATVGERRWRMSSSIKCRNIGEWLDLRKTGIGSSDAAAILGLSTYRSPYAVWAEKTGAVRDEFTETPRQRWGKKLEQLIADEFEEQTATVLYDPGQWTIYTHPDLPYMQCTPDRLTAANGVVELKTAGLDRAADWADGPPLAYQVQLQHQIDVLGMTHGYLAVLIGGSDFRWYRQERNDKFLTALESRLGEFWALVESNTPPVVDGHKATREALAKLHPADNGSTVELDELTAQLGQELLAVKAEVKALESREAELENRLRAAIGDATFGDVAGGVWSLKTQAREGYLKVPVSMADRLESADIEYKPAGGSTFRVLRYKEISNG